MTVLKSFYDQFVISHIDKKTQYDNPVLEAKQKNLQSKSNPTSTIDNENKSADERTGVLSQLCSACVTEHLQDITIFV